MTTKNNKIEILKFILSRYDHYLNAVNVKGRFIIGLFTFIAAFLIYNIESILESCPAYLMWINIPLLLISIGLCFSGVSFVIKAVFPYLNAGNSSKDGYHSLIYFGSVSVFTSHGNYYEKLANRSIEDFEKDLTFQTYELSKSLNKKYSAIKVAMNHLYVLGVALLILILTKIIWGLV